MQVSPHARPSVQACTARRNVPHTARFTCSAPRAGCQEVLYEEGPDGKPFVTSLRMRKAGKTSYLKADVYVAALDCGGAKRMIPAPWRKYPIFDNIYQLDGVPVITVQLRCATPGLARCRRRCVHMRRVVSCTQLAARSGLLLPTVDLAACR